MHQTESLAMVAKVFFRIVAMSPFQQMGCLMASFALFIVALGMGKLFVNLKLSHAGRLRWIPRRSSRKLSA
jgi:hypothetical protein